MPSSQSLGRRCSGQVMRPCYRTLSTYLYHEKVLADPEAREARRLAMWTRLSVIFRSMALSQGRLFIKAGQILSARSDIFPRAFIRQLASLQDEVPGVAFERIRGVIEKEFGQPIAHTFSPSPPARPTTSLRTKPHPSVGSKKVPTEALGAQ